MFSIEFCSLANFGGLVDGFQLRRIRRDEVAREAARSLSRASPRVSEKWGFLKTRVVSSGTLLASLDPAIKFADELAESLPSAPAVSVYRQACSGIPLAVGL